MITGMIIYALFVLFIFFFFMFLVGEKYFLGIAGTRKKIVRFGMLIICLSLSLFLLFPFIFFSKGFNDFYSALKAAKEQAKEKLNSLDEISMKEIINEIENFKKLPLFLSSAKANIPLIAIGSGIQFLILVIVITLIILTREPVKRKKIIDNRKHIFEYKNILNTLNKGE